ncbi:hypothetical protein GCT13_32450 [Paraburkholderia sp. CNPSo 3157]|uniref:Uncharacterized protein n=1 Tax=Paraburkholderia franconis TaxID=2654983 RepID=A0A7X1NH16_9BURK|nr:hypothetical protein [Paraburkholderia franconis]MPW21456.1 hypothetical protein [Paraburkholderia franconis]
MKRLPGLLVCCAASLLAACSSVGPTQLKADQVDYSRALGEAKKREILAAIIALRFADAPSFLTVSQIIAAYNVDASASSTLNAGSGAVPNYASVTGTVSYSNHPTFTFTPTTGEAYAQAYIRPLAPTLVLPLAEGGIPIDLLLRVSAQSIGGLQNGSALGGENSAGSPQFFQLIQALRRLQMAGELNVESRTVKNEQHVYLILGTATTTDAQRAAPDLQLVRKLLHLNAKTGDYEIVYGQSSRGGNQIAMLTRSVLGILTDLGAQVHVPDQKIEDGSTKPTVTLVGGETRPTIIVQNGDKPPADAYAVVRYGPSTYWVDRSDFDSKYAFTVVQNLMALAEAETSSKAPIVTIPAN